MGIVFIVLVMFLTQFALLFYFSGVEEEIKDNIDKEFEDAIELLETDNSTSELENSSEKKNELINYTRKLIDRNNAFVILKLVRSLDRKTIIHLAKMYITGERNFSCFQDYLEKQGYDVGEIKWP